MAHLTHDILECPRVAVYGTLKQGHRNHHWMENAYLLGQDRLTTLSLYDLGPYPGAKALPSQGVSVEVYVINAEQLAFLDQLEGYAAAAPSEGLYNRAIFPTRHGKAWCYLYNREVNERMKIETGEW
ncbi:MAG: gamma-glutamylcyclotransferase family protein [Halomonas sp.]